MVASDRRDRWPEGLFHDKRVTEYWDEDHAAGRWFASMPRFGDCTHGGTIAWDAYYLFPPEARWSDAPQPLVISGCPIVKDREVRERLKVEAAAMAAAQKQRPR